MASTPHARRRVTLTFVGMLALAGLIAALAVPGTRADHARDRANAAAVSKTTAKQAAFHDAMRKLWEDHITWTRLAIVSFAGDLPDLPATEARLLRNQTDIGNAVRPFYGKTAGDKLTALLKEHIAGAVALMQAARSGDQAAVARAKADWYVNGRQVSDFLSSANPAYLPRGEMRSMMRMHLDQTLSEAVNQLEGDYAASVRDYDAIHRHILEMADALSDGIIKQFPRRFR